MAEIEEQTLVHTAVICSEIHLASQVGEMSRNEILTAGLPETSVLRGAHGVSGLGAKNAVTAGAPQTWPRWRANVRVQRP